MTEHTWQEILELEAREYSSTRLWPMYLVWRDLVDAMERAERDGRNGFEADKLHKVSPVS
jgi:hypothetical protein